MATTKLTRRQFAKMASASAIATSSVGSFAYAKGTGKIVIVGGGAGGATVAHLIKRAAPNLDIILIEVNRHYTSCFFSNPVLGGLRNPDLNTHNYSGLKKLGVTIIHDLATDVDTAKKTVSLKDGHTLTYDKLILSPGIDFKWETIEGYDETVAQKIPHAWKGGAQTKLLLKQLKAMKDGGLVVMTAPPDPFRCPPGPYERASMIAHFIKTQKPKSKLIIFDSKPEFALMELFYQGWEAHYKDIIEWESPDITDGGVKQVDAAAMAVTTGGGDTIKADVMNIIPAQKAGLIANISGCTEGDWCPIKPDDFSSTKVKDVYVLGDSTFSNDIPNDMPKSASLANSQAKAVANAILTEFLGQKKIESHYYNVCWSLLSPDNCIKYEAIFEAGKQHVDITWGFLSALEENKDVRTKTYQDSLTWYARMTSEMFAKG